MYCNAACKKKHRHKHKKECERRVAELHDEKLFKRPPHLEDCPICMIRLPTLESGRMYMACCGKILCIGCIYAVQSRSKGHPLCPFCRVLTPVSSSSDGEMIRRFEKRVELNDSYAIYSMGTYYAVGLYGFHQNRAKALEFWHRAAELGNSSAYYNIALCYDHGSGVERDEKEANHYYELAATGGDVKARLLLGKMEARAGNGDRALNHFMIAVRDGNLHSLEGIKRLYSKGHATKDEYAKALRLYQAYLVEIKNNQRDQAAAAREDYKYYGSVV